MIKQNQLPNFNKIIKKGVYGDLRSVNPPVTCPAWATMLTGKNPATLGVFDFFKPTPNYKLGLSKLNWKKWRPIWDIFSDAGKKVCVFNIPTTTATKINGYFISGPIWGEDEDLLAYPKELNEQLVREKYQIRSSGNNKIEGDKVYVNDIKRITENKFKIMFKYYNEFNWDLFILGFYYCDQLSHAYWKYLDRSHPKFSQNSRLKNVLYEHYALLDTYLGQILENIPDDTTLFVVSDHGHRSINRAVNLNAWLHKSGFLSIKKSYQIKHKRLSNNRLKKIYFLSRTYSEVIHFLGLRYKSFFKNIKLKLIDTANVIENKYTIKQPLRDYVNWNNTTAYSMTFNTISLNLKGREAKGSISKQEYHKERKKIIEELKKLKDPKNNKKVIDKIWTKEDIYPNSPPDDFPDIYIQFNKGFRNTFSETDDPRTVFFDPPQGSTEHYLEGIFLAYGAEIETGKKVNIKLEDIVPTILHICDYQIPEDIDGRVTLEILKHDSESAQREIKKQRISRDRKLKSEIRSIKFTKKI